MIIIIQEFIFVCFLQRHIRWNVSLNNKCVSDWNPPVWFLVFISYAVQIWDNLVIYWDVFWGIEINAELRLWLAAIWSQTGKINRFSNSWINPPMPLHACTDTRTLLSEPSAPNKQGTCVLKCNPGKYFSPLPLWNQKDESRCLVTWRVCFGAGWLSFPFPLSLAEPFVSCFCCCWWWETGKK